MNSLTHLKNGYSWLTLLFVATLPSGCFQATNKFYADSDVITDSRFEGRFEPQLAANDPAVPCSALVKLKDHKHYVVTLEEGKAWIQLEAVLFKIGTNLFVDISQASDSPRARLPPHLVSRQHLDQARRQVFR